MYRITAVVVVIFSFAICAQAQERRAVPVYPDALEYAAQPRIFDKDIYTFDVEEGKSLFASVEPVWLDLDGNQVSVPGNWELCLSSTGGVRKETGGFTLYPAREGTAIVMLYCLESPHLCWVDQAVFVTTKMVSPAEDYTKFGEVYSRIAKGIVGWADVDYAMANGYGLPSEMIEDAMELAFLGLEPKTHFVLHLSDLVEKESGGTYTVRYPTREEYKGPLIRGLGFAYFHRVDRNSGEVKPFAIEIAKGELVLFGH